MNFSYAIVCNIREDVPVLQIHVVGYKERFTYKQEPDIRQLAGTAF